MTSGIEGWTIETHAAYNEAMRLADLRYNDAMRMSMQELQTERDRRYSEVKIEVEKALRIKETADVKIKETKEIADLAALTLARDIQTYKDEKADKTRDLGLSERGAYVTHADLSSVVDEIKGSLKPLFDYVSSQEGVVKGSQITTGKLYAMIIGAAALSGMIAVVVDMFTK